jgi:uncharacterized protein YndB with AHSA1/START domain
VRPPRRCAAGPRPTPDRIEQTVEIAAPPEDVFPYLEVSHERLRWMGLLVESAPVEKGRFHDVFEDRGHRIDIDAEVVERDPPRLLVVRLRSSSFEATSTQKLEAVDVGTRLTTVVETTYTKRLARLAGPFVARRAQQQLERDLETLKELAEVRPC